MQFSKLKNSTAAKATAPEATAPTVPAPEVAATPTTAVAIAPSVGHALTMFQSADATAALVAMTEDDGRGSRSVYPVIDISGGNTGGAFQPAKGTPEEVGDSMPQGRKPFTCFFLGYRTEVYAWPEAKSDTDGEGKAAKPVWRVMVPCSDGAATRLIRQALENYTFKPKADKAMFDWASSEVGHLKVRFQALVFQPEMGALAVVQGTPHFKSWVRSGESVLKLIDPATKRWTGEPVQAKVLTSDEQGAVPWKMHSLLFNLMPEAERAKYLAIAKDFAATMAENPEEQSKALDWLTCKGNTWNDDIAARLTKSLAF